MGFNAAIDAVMSAARDGRADNSAFAVMCSIQGSYDACNYLAAEARREGLDPAAVLALYGGEYPRPIISAASQHHDG